MTHLQSALHASPSHSGRWFFNLMHLLQRIWWTRRAGLLALGMAAVLQGAVALPQRAQAAQAVSAKAGATPVKAVSKTPGTTFNGLTINVTDKGINQMPKDKSHPHSALQWTMSGLEPSARVAVFMPAIQHLDPAQIPALRKKTFDDLKAAIDAGRRPGIKTFEIQLVEDINTTGYLTDLVALGKRQSAVDRFGAAAYGAIADLNKYLKQAGVPVINHAVLGSNGTKMFAANIDAWSPSGVPIWARVDMFDGRAFMTPMLKVIERVGVENIRIFNTRGDYFAPHTPWALRSIGNVGTSRQIKDRHFPPLKVYQLEPLQKGWAHITAMNDTDSFLVQEYTGRKTGLKSVPGRFQGSDLRPGKPLPSAVDRTVPAAATQDIAVWRGTAQDLVGVLSRYAGDYAELRGKASPGTPKFKSISTGVTLSNAILQDLAEAGDGPVAVLKSRTVEQLAKFVLADLAESRLANDARFMPFAKNVGAIQEVYSGLMEVARTGKVDSGTMKSFDSAVVELAKVQLAERHARGPAAKHGIATLKDAAEEARRMFRIAENRASVAAPNRDIARTRRNDLRIAGHRLATQEARLADAQRAVAQAEKRFATRLLMLDVLPELAGAVAEHAKQGHFTVDVADRYSDGLLLLSASIAAGFIAEVPVLAPFAPTIRDGMVAGGRFVRDQVLREPIGQMYAGLSGHKWEALEQYNAYLARAAHENQPAKSFTEMYGDDELTRLGFNQRSKDALDEVAAKYNASRSRPAVRPDPNAVPDVGEPGHPRGEDRDRTARKPPSSTDYLPPRSSPTPSGGGRADDGDGRAARGGGGGGGSRSTNGERASAPPTRSPASPSTGVGENRSRPVTPPSAAVHPRSPAIPTPGGVLPDPSANTRYAAMPVVDAVVVDAATGRLVLLTKGTATDMAPIDPSTFAFALWSVYTGKRIAFSLDPLDRNPNGQWLRAVNYPEETAGLGLPAQSDMYDGDVLLKMFQFGVQREGDRLVARPRGPLPSLPQMLEEEDGAKAGGWTRSWIVPELVELSFTDGVVRVQQVKMAVRARRQVVDRSSPTGLRDVDTDPRSVEARWAHKATQMYDQIATSGEAPSWAAIAELSKALAIAHWLKKSGARVDVGALVTVLNAHRAPHVEKMRALDVSFHREERTPFDDGKSRGVRTTRHEIRLFGGVDPNGRLKLIEEPRVASLREAVRTAMVKAPASTRFELVDGGTHYVASALPFPVMAGPAGALQGAQSGPMTFDSDGRLALR